jgi:hypothetical protein
LDTDAIKNTEDIADDEECLICYENLEKHEEIV